MYRKIVPLLLRTFPVCFLARKIHRAQSAGIIKSRRPSRVVKLAIYYYITADWRNCNNFNRCTLIASRFRPGCKPDVVYCFSRAIIVRWNRAVLKTLWNCHCCYGRESIAFGATNGNKMAAALFSFFRGTRRPIAVA